MEILNSHRISSEVASSSVTGRSFEWYQKFFDYKLEDLQGKKILDVGPGNSNFSTVAKRYGANVVDLDPQPNGKSKSVKVKGIAQFLPFREETFDDVISSYGIYWVTTGIREALFEMLRVTKNGGRVMVYPVIVKHGAGWGELLPQGSELSEEENRHFDPWQRLMITKDVDLYQDSGSQRKYIDTLVNVVPTLDRKAVPDYFEFPEKKPDLSYY